tara:strand:+ start:4034 stop:4363 length:330 start_codon:yes stop_codon:yes gene_type:complete
MSNTLYSRTALSHNGEAIQAGKLGTVQKVAVATASAAVTNAFATSTSLVRVAVSTDCYIVFATTPTATTSDTFLPAGSVEYFLVEPSTKAAFIRNTADGVATVTEMAVV